MKKLSLLLSQLNKDSGAPITLRRRLFLYFLILTLVGIATIFLLISITGVFSQAEQQTGKLSELELSLLSERITEHYDTVAARGISLSKDLSKIVGDYLHANRLTIVDLNNDGERLRQLQLLCYQPLHYSLQNTRCSGIFYMLDATVNTSSSDGNSYNGMCLKLENLNTTQSLNSKAVLFRGSNSIARDNDFKLHSRWNLEFSESDIPFFDTLKTQSNTNVNKSYYWSQTIPIENAWDASMLLCVPLISEQGEFLGICGMEISNLYFKLEYSFENSPFANCQHILVPMKDHELYIANGLSGSMVNSIENSSDTKLPFYQKRYFNYYENKDNTYIGLHNPINLSPVTDDKYQWVCAVLVPAGSYLSHAASARWKIIAISLGFLVCSLLLCFWFSHKYVEPIMDSINAIRSNKIHKKKTNIEEIDDLLEFLNQKEQIELSEKTSKQKKAELPAVDTEKYQHFINNLNTLSPAEQRVFDLYLKEYKAKDIAAELCLSMNTIKYHNANIYSKLSVSSRKELLLFMKHMQKELSSQL